MKCMCFCSRLYAVFWPISLLSLQPPRGSLQDEEYDAPRRKCLCWGLQTLCRYCAVIVGFPHTYVVYPVCYYSGALTPHLANTNHFEKLSTGTLSRKQKDLVSPVRNLIFSSACTDERSRRLKGGCWRWRGVVYRWLLVQQ